ncbi:CDK-activating kinase assembly factor MAT1 [Binucleata daphniae]
MTELMCPVCKSNSYLNPSIRIYISPCYHKMCQTCLNRVFSQSQAPCPECGTTLRKVNYISQTFEDIEVERECKIRKSLMQVYFRKESDFQTVNKYNDYLEEFENIVFELVKLNENEISVKLGELKKRYGMFEQSQEVIKKHKTEEIVVFDPLKDVKIPTAYVTQKHKIPSYFKINHLISGYTENLLIYKAVMSLYDNEI